MRKGPTNSPRNPDPRTTPSNGLDAARAAHNLNGREFDGRVLKVNEALERTDRGGERRVRPLRH